MSTPTWTVEVAFAGSLTGVFTIGYSVIDGTDEIAGTFGNNVYDDLTDLVIDVQISRGRNSSLGAMQQGTCRLRLVDEDGTYNPENPSSPLVNRLVPMRPVHVGVYAEGAEFGVDSFGETYFGAGDFDLFHGYIKRIEHDPWCSVQETIIEAGDLFEWLGTIKPVIASTGTTNVGTVIGLILDAAEFTETPMRDLDTGMSIPDFSADGSQDALALIEALLTVDLGTLFLNGNGVATYRDRAARFGRTAVQYAMTGSHLAALRPATDAQGLVNRQSVTRTGGVAQEYTDETSRRQYGYRDGSAIDSAYLKKDAEALSLATFLVLLQKDPRVPTRQATLENISDIVQAAQLAAELGTRVSVAETDHGTSVDGTLEGLSHTIAEAGTIFQTQWAVSRRRLDAFTIGSSQI